MQIFKELGFLVRCCTSREATNLGIFFAELMSMVSHWRDPIHYGRHCTSSEAFRSYKAGALEQVSHSEFVKLSANWHRKLTLDVFRTCLGSADYMQMKNALLVLNRMVRIYPATKEDITELLRMLAPIRDDDPREDLKTLARMYCTSLEVAQRDKTRAIVGTRQEYAGLPPPPRKKPAKQPADGGAQPKKERSERKELPADEEEKNKEGSKEKSRDKDDRKEKEKDKVPARDDDRRRDRRDDGAIPGRDRDQRDRSRDLRDQDRSRAGRGDAAPPSRAPYVAEERGDKAEKGVDRGERLRGRGEDRRSALRPDAPDFEPITAKESRRSRPAEEPPVGRERDAKRMRRDDRDVRDSRAPVQQQRDTRDQATAIADRQGQTTVERGGDRHSGRRFERDSTGKRKRDDEVGSVATERQRHGGSDVGKGDLRGAPPEPRSRGRSASGRDESARLTDPQSVDLAPRRDRPREQERERERERVGREREREREGDKDRQRDVRDQREPEQQTRERERAVDKSRTGPSDYVEGRRQEAQPPQDEGSRPAPDEDDRGYNDRDSDGSQRFDGKLKRQRHEDKRRRKDKGRERKDYQREDQRAQPSPPPPPAVPSPPPVFKPDDAPSRLRGRLGTAPTIVNGSERRAEPVGGDPQDRREEQRPFNRGNGDRDRGRDRGRNQNQDAGRDFGRERGRDRERGRRPNYKM